MEIGDKNLDKLFKSILSDVCSNYIYAHLDKEEINRLAIKALKKFKLNVYKSDEDAIKKYYSILDNTFKTYIDRNVYKNIERGYLILSDLVNVPCDTSDINKIKLYLNSFINRLHNISFEPPIKLYFMLFERNSNFLSIFDTIYSKYENLIKKDDLDKIFDDDIISIIELYCMYKGIEIDYAVNNDNKINAAVILTDSMKIYKNEISEYRVLTREEEYDLGRKIQAGIKASERLENDALTDYERKELEELVKIKEQAFDKLVKHNLRLVFGVARKYLYTGVPFSDLVQEGNVGLLEAANRYDPELGYRFSTYGMWWIRQKIYRSLGEQTGVVRIPVYMFDRNITVLKAREQVMVTYNREATLEEISKITGLKEIDVRQCLESLQPVKYISESVFQGDRDPIEFGDTLSSSESIEDNYIDNDMIERVRSAFESAKLSSFERDIVIRRFGLYGRNRDTLEVIARDYNCTREWVRQNEKRALKKLHGINSIKACYNYVESNEYNRGKKNLYSSTTKYESPIQRERRCLKTRKTIYETLRDYPKFIVDIVGSKCLDSEDKKLLIKRNGDLGFNSISGAELTDTERGRYKSLINKFKRCIREYIVTNRNEVYTYYYQNAIDKDVYWLLEDLIGGENAILVCLYLGLTFDHEKYSTKCLSSYFYLSEKVLTNRIEEALKLARSKLKNSIDNEGLKTKFGF